MKHLERTMFLLISLCFIWCLSLSYFTLSNDKRCIQEKRLSQHDKKQMGANGAGGKQRDKAGVSPTIVWSRFEEELSVLRSKSKMKEDLIIRLNSKKLQLEEEVAGLRERLNKEAEKRVTPASPVPLVHYEREFKALQMQMKEEENKTKMREEMIKGLNSDKEKLEKEVAHLKEVLVQKEKQAEKDTIEDKNCPLPPMDGYPECKKKIEWMKQMWTSDPCYRINGVNGSVCSILIYLSEVNSLLSITDANALRTSCQTNKVVFLALDGTVMRMFLRECTIESWCPLLPGRVIPTAATQHTETGQAVVRDSLQGLTPKLGDRIQYKWIHQRILSMENIWLKAGRSLSAQYDLKDRKAKRILVHPGAVLNEVGIAQAAFSGGPLGELVQWSDLISTLHILGHEVHLSGSLNDIKILLGVMKSGCPTMPVGEPDLIYTDILGFNQMQKAIPNIWSKYQCRIRVLDSFGTEPDFNHIVWAKQHNLSSPYGSLNLIPMQFYTMFPHTPDNTFLGFVVQPHWSDEENKRLKSVQRKKQALVYGKRESFWKNKTAYLDVIHKYLDVHGTVDKTASIPSYVTNHGIVKGAEVHALLRESKVFVGLSFPYEGPAPLEALANGCIFLNPRLNPPQSSLNSEFFKEKPNIREVTSQHPYAEAIGEPYVWMVDMDNSTDVERAVKGIINQTIEPYVPYEFTCEGMLQRVNVLIEKQDFCSNTTSWPPLSSLQVVRADVNSSCKTACQKQGLICEPAFFPHLNSAQSLANDGIDCRTTEHSGGYLVLPAYDNSTKHCMFQSDPLLFSCVRSHPSWTRVCPCRDYIKDQIALCKACL